MSVDHRAAITAKAEAMVENRSAMSPVAYCGLADEVARGYLSLLAELEAAEDAAGFYEGEARHDSANNEALNDRVTELEAERDRLHTALEEARTRALRDAVAECQRYENSFAHPYPHPEHWKTEVMHKKAAAIEIEKRIRALGGEE